MIILCFRGKINISGCGAVGSARGSGLRGRQFESGHPDHYEKRNNPLGIIFVFICIGATRWERSSTGRRSERKIKACFCFSERGGTEGFWKNPNLVTQTIQGEKIKKIYFLYLIDAEWKDFAKAKAYHEIILTKIKKDWNDSSLFGYK